MSAPAAAELLPSPAGILGLGMGFMASRTLLAAVEFEVFTFIAASSSGSLTRGEIEAKAGLHPRSSRDFLDSLVALNMLHRTGTDVYSNTAASDLFLDQAKPSFVGGMLKMASVRLYKSWASLPTCLRTGQPVTASGDADPFESLYSTPEHLESFLSAMTGASTLANRGIASCAEVGWAKYKTFCDAGTAQGDLAVQVALANSHLTGVGADLPACESIFNKYAQKNEVDARVKFEGLDFFKQPLPSVDVILMGHILHDWDLPKKKGLIAAAFKALPIGGAFIVYDELIDNERRTAVPGLMMSLNMLIETPGGFDYSAADGKEWLEEAGFKSVRHIQLGGPNSFLLAVK